MTKEFFDTYSKFYTDKIDWEKIKQEFSHMKDVVDNKREKILGFNNSVCTEILEFIDALYSDSLSINQFCELPLYLKAIDSKYNIVSEIEDFKMFLLVNA